MKKISRNIIWSLCLLLPIVLGMKAGTSLMSSKIRHEVTYIHPGNKEGVDSSFVLFEEQDDQGLAIQYYMDVESVICLEDVCQVVPVRLYWNNIGQFKKYELSEGFTLEKGDGEPFENDDYILLEKILKDKNSPFKILNIEEIISSIPVHGEEVDGYSGATTLMLEDTACVKGAALTCFTLWHWANGDIKDSIKNITGSELNATQLLSFYKNSNVESRLFALEQLTRNKKYDKTVFTYVLDKATLAKTIEIKTILAYMESIPSSNYFWASEQLMAKGDENLRILTLSSLLNYKEKASDSFYDKVASYLPKFDSYAEVNLLLTIFEDNQISSPQIKEQALSLLKKDILVARRAYWYLEGQELSASQRKTYSAFRKKNQDYL